MDISEFQVPFRHWVIDGAVPEFEIDRAMKSIAGADSKFWIHYDNENERKRTANSLDLGLTDMLQRWPWIAFLERVTGIVGLQPDPELYGGGVHMSESGGFLRPHVDYAFHPHRKLHRKLNAILFLNAEWNPEWGGAFELYDDRGEVLMRKVYPAPGRLVLWEPSDSAFHGCGEVTGQAARVTAAVYYLSEPKLEVSRKRALFVPLRK